MFITINFGKDEENTRNFLATASTAIRYKQVFHEDLITTMQHINEAGEISDYLNVSQKLGFIMNMQADKKPMESLNQDQYLDWLDQFEPLAFVAAGAQIIQAYRVNEENSSVAKKKNVEQSAD